MQLHCYGALVWFAYCYLLPAFPCATNLREISSRIIAYLPFSSAVMLLHILRSRCDVKSFILFFVDSFLSWFSSAESISTSEICAVPFQFYV